MQTGASEGDVLHWLTFFRVCGPGLRAGVRAFVQWSGRWPATLTHDDHNAPGEGALGRSGWRTPGDTQDDDVATLPCIEPRIGETDAVPRLLNASLAWLISWPG